MIRAVLSFVLTLSLAGPLAAQELRALARIVAEDSAARDAGRGAEISLGLSQPVPFRVALADNPPRLVLDLREVVWDGLPEGFDAAEAVTGVVTGAAGLSPGWSRMVLSLDRPLGIETAAMTTDPGTGQARVSITLTPVSAEQFAAMAAADSAIAAPVRSAPAPSAPGRLVVALDPGHGGVDPGAQSDGHDEADLTLLFARELAERLIRTGQVDVVLTRTEDVFVPLPERVSIARGALADLFVSLHADALAEGRATGATVYTLSDSASDAASAALAERFDRMDLLQGVDLSQSDDEIADVLMDLARLDTDARSEALADTLVAGIASSDAGLHRHSRLEAGFTVLTAPDIPSVLVELGFLSDPRDLERLTDPDWRASFQDALVQAILDWAATDAAEAALRRQ
ncbi:AMIN domain-containing protein [Rhodobacterales bacterium HKCCE3408]|nr:AMIN domain-containing protein [Rhodobacterales bacterium HKCCE3408]